MKRTSAADFFAQTKHRSLTERDILSAIEESRLHGRAKVDFHVPRELWMRFEHFLLIFMTVDVGIGDIGEHMKAQCRSMGVARLVRTQSLTSPFIFIVIA